MKPPLYFSIQSECGIEHTNITKIEIFRGLLNGPYKVEYIGPWKEYIKNNPKEPICVLLSPILQEYL